MIEMTLSSRHRIRFCDIWIKQAISESTCFNVKVNQRLLDQKWRSDVDTGVKCYEYRLFKPEFIFENYF